ncbi:MAG: bifunctional phosphopantothenoylcysteine decarboxylase/phosphopantothenate--cysteine ligase CoaBC [Actinobacteria bacterium]|nr:bifunctional phosphopantothenoylcysteine decarboxylase/phosphopantothenate--cysteine ligase CoaBC [Actinomycetota bacterium]
MDPSISSLLNKKKIILGITGSIAAYKAADICSKLVKSGAVVYPVMSPNALYFINPITFSALSSKKTIVEQFINEEKIQHISLSHSVDLIIIAPATANTISKLACGICDNFLTTAVIASYCPVIIAPAMNESMYLNKAITENIEKLEKTGKYFFVGPVNGNLACGEEGIGRLADKDAIIEKASMLVKYSNDLSGKKIIVTSGGTREYIDSARFISNRSSGKMGHELAAEAYFRGARNVTLITTNKNSVRPYGVETIMVEDTSGMKEEILKRFKQSDITIMAAAVSDIIPENKFNYKLKKNDDIISKLKFKENVNILKMLSELKNKNQILVGFSAESGEKIENSKSKISEKNIDMIVLNDISRDDIGFESDFNEVFLIHKNGDVKKLEKNSKRIIARQIFDEILGGFYDK